MVAPAEPRRIKWRHHCSTCGVKFDPPRTWAYCSKDCERGRRGHSVVDSGACDEWSSVLVEERLRLLVELEDTPTHLRSEVLAKLAANEAKEAAVRAELAALDAPKDSLVFWAPLLRTAADRFELTLRRSFAAALRLGRRLVEAKALLPHGEFGRLFRDSDDPIEHPLPFGRHWASRLMRVAEHPVLANKEHAPVLPVDLNLVYQLCRVPADELEAAIARGEVTPAMRRADVRLLLPVEPAPDEPDPPPDDEITAFLSPVQAQLAAFAADHPSQFGDLKARLKAMLRAIENEVLRPAGESAGTELMPAAERGDIDRMGNQNDACSGGA